LFSEKSWIYAVWITPSAAAAPLRRLAGSSREPRWTPAPAAASATAAWEVVAAAFGEHDAPSTLLGVAVLGYRDQLVEIEAVAAVAG
jgi:hypothetical protein